MGNINRDDMLELTRRMTLSRNCFSRIAGVYIDEDGFVDGTFNRHFLKLSNSEQEFNLKIAKAVPFAQTNVELKEYKFPEDKNCNGSVLQFLNAIRQSELKNDAILDIFYDVVAERYTPGQPYTMMFFYGSYDIPRKGKDKESQWESEEVYQFIVGAVCPISGDYEAGETEFGFLYPAFKDRSGDCNYIDIYDKKTGVSHKELVELLFS